MKKVYRGTLYLEKMMRLSLKKSARFTEAVQLKLKVDLHFLEKATWFIEEYLKTQSIINYPILDRLIEKENCFILD